MATWEITYTHSPSSLKFNGVALTSYTSIAAAQLAGRGWCDLTRTVGKLYIVLGGGDTPYSGTVQAFLSLCFSTTPKIFSNIYYDPRITSLPNISKRIEPDFTAAIEQIGGGSLELENTDGVLNAYRGMQWEAGSTVLKMGVDTIEPDGTLHAMAYTDYLQIGSWRNARTSANKKGFLIGLVEHKNRLRKKLPLTFYDTATYPGIYQADIGKPIPLAYGQIYGAPAVCTDTSARTFKFASHAVFSIGQIRYLDTATRAWTTIIPTATSTAAATFTLPASWNGKDPISVDFAGRVTGTGALMANPADVIKDILEQAGETTSTYSAASFTAARAYWVIGTIAGAESCFAKPSLFVNSATEALVLIGQVIRAAGAYLQAGADGLLALTPFKPIPGEQCTTYTEADIFDLSWSEDVGDIKSTVIATYQEYISERYKQITTATDATVATEHGDQTTAVLTIDTDLYDSADATYQASRNLYQAKQTERRLNVTLPWKSITATPGSFVRIDFSAQGLDLDQVFEVIEQRGNLRSGEFALTLGDLHGLETCGFIVADAAVLPSRFALLAGYGTGALAWNNSWDNEIKRWARQNIAYHCDANGFASPTDPESYQGSKTI